MFLPPSVVIISFGKLKAFLFVVLPSQGWGETSRTLVLCCQVCSHPIRNQCMGRFASPPLSFGYVKMTQIYGLTFLVFVLHKFVFACHGGFTRCFRPVLGVIPLVTFLGLIISLLKSCSYFQYVPWREQLLVLRFSVLVVFLYLIRSDEFSFASKDKI